jgi:hypothetical protein
MHPAPVGTRIRVISNTGNHSYAVGQVYKVTFVDNDGTFKAADATGRVGNWLRWECCEPAGASIWERIAADLPDDLVAFLSCFDGIADIELGEPVVDAVLGNVPDVHERLVTLARSPVGKAFLAANAPQPTKPAGSARGG